MNTGSENNERWARNRESGFTLIEMIAVLIILGILAAVAVPKYFDISEEAKKKAFESAIAQGKSLCSLAYAKAAVDAGGNPTLKAIEDILIDAEQVNIEGDFKYTFNANDSASGCGSTKGIDINVTGVDTDGPFAGYSEEGVTTPGMTRTWCLP